MSIDVAFIGLGVMGREMARHLVGAGHRVRVFNRTTAKAEAFVAAHGGTLADSPRSAARGADVALVCVGDDDDLREVVAGPDGVLGGLAEGALIIDHSTTSAGVARELAARAKTQGIAFVDAPVSGGQRGAIEGVLTIMCGGDEAAFARTQAMVAPYARACARMGDVGAGQLTKMVNQICFAGVIAGLAEGMAFAENAGLDVARVIDVISKGAASSWQMVNRHETMIAGDFDHGFAVDFMRKDLGICQAEGRSNASELPITQLVDGFYEDVQAMGGGRWDTSSLVQRLRARRATRA